MVRTTLFALLIGASLMAQDLPARPEAIHYPPLAFAVPSAKAYKAVLRNGMTVYLAGEPEGVPFVRLKVLIKGGSYLDPAGKEGLAALTGSQMRGGGTRTTSATDLDERLEFLAGSLTADLGDTSGSVSLTILEKDLKEGLDLFMQVLTQPAFAQDRLDRAKEALMQSMQARNDEAGTIAKLETSRLLYGQNHFASAAPTSASLAAITREDLAAFHARLLHPGNLVVSVSGRFQREAMLRLLEGTLGHLKAGPSALPSPAVPKPDHRPEPGLYVVDKDIPQSVVRFVLPGLRRTDPDWHAALVMNEILGGSGFSCRLMKKIRSDEGLTYGIGSAFGEGTYWRGNWSGAFQTKNISVPYALRLLLAELERIKADKVPAAELATIKAGMIEAFPSRWGKKASVVNFFASEQLAGYPEDWWSDYREKIQAVTAEDVLRAARKYLDASKLQVLVVGKAAEAEAGDTKDHPGPLKDVAPLPLKRLPLRDPLTLQPLS